MKNSRMTGVFHLREKMDVNYLKYSEETIDSCQNPDSRL